jgi:hypothetical protein
VYIVWNTTRTIGVVTHESGLVQEIAQGAFKMRAQDCKVEELDYNAQSQRIIELERLAYVPGVLYCPRCGLSLNSMRFDAATSRIAASNPPDELCINCAGPLQRLSERDAGNRLCDRNEALLKEIRQLNEERQWLRNSIVLAVGHLKKRSISVAEVILRAAITLKKKETVQ